MSRRPARGPRGLLAACLLAALLVVIPVLVTIVQAIQGGVGALRTALGASSTATLVLHSLEVAAAATPVCAVIGVGAAWFVERTRLPGRRLWAVLLVAPLTIPPFVTSYAWAGLGSSFQGFVGAAGIIGFTYYPIVFLLVAVALGGGVPPPPGNPGSTPRSRRPGARSGSARRGRSSGSCCRSSSRRCSAGSSSSCSTR